MPIPRPSKHETYLAIWATLAAFGCYFCMYGFRKPFTAGIYADTTALGIAFKPFLVISHVLGYMLSKFIGIRVISEISAANRILIIVLLISAAEIALVLFGLIPRPWNAICLFLNGLPLGMIFGLILRFLEGRRFTEAMSAGLCASFIMADGVSKSVGSWLLKLGVGEDWMPSLAGAIFLLPLLLCTWMLRQVPPPTTLDEQIRSARSIMSRTQRWLFFRKYAIGLVPIIILYLAITIVRSIRADFAPEIWTSLGAATVPSVFTTSETWVALGVLLVNGLSITIRSNRAAFFGSLAVCGAGTSILAIALLGLHFQRVDSFTFMVLVGLGLYLPYVAIHTTIFERLMAMTREVGNIGFLMYLADSIGYLGYVAIMLLRNSNGSRFDWLSLLVSSSWVAVLLSIVCLLQTSLFFYSATPTEPQRKEPQES